MTYLIATLGLALVCLLVGYAAGTRKAPRAPRLPLGVPQTFSQLHAQQSRSIKLRQTLDKYEDFVMRLGADDVGNPQLEARVLIQETRRDNNTF